VTDKGALLDVGYFDFTVVRPHLVIAILLGIGVIAVSSAPSRMTTLADPRFALNVGWGFTA
jgi:cellulose synthase (UDP-forming)